MRTISDSIGDFVDDFTPGFDPAHSPRTPRSRKRVGMRGANDPDSVAGPTKIDPRMLAIFRGETYKPGPTLKRFHDSAAFVRGIRGPVGAGKSTGCCAEIMRRAREQVAGPDGIRRSRWVVVRNTYGELKDTTVKTWLDWFPEELFGKFNRAQGEMRHTVRVEDIELEVLFRALDKPDDIRKVLSLELTGAWCNEARELPRQIIEALGDRVGRYPAVRDGGCTWRGIIMDTNSPDDEHWWHELAEVNQPEGWEFFAQPPALIQIDGKWCENPETENAANLEPHYYKTRMAGKREDYIKVYYGNQYGFVQTGKPVFPEYADAVHGSKTDLPLIAQKPVYVGIGIGLESIALFGQKKDNGQWIWCDELAPQTGGAVHFAEMLSAKMKSDFPSGTQFKVFSKRPADPDDDDSETIQILRRRGVNVSPCRISDEVLRREAVAGVLNRLVTGEPALSVLPRCKVARKSMSGGYCYGRIQSSGEERYHDTPMDNRYKLMGEAAQYMLVGGGEDAHVMRTQKPTKLKYQEIGVV